MPQWLQPASNMDDMRDLLAGKDAGRDGLIMVEAVVTALAWRTQQALTVVVDAEGHSNRMNELHGLFELVQRCRDAWTFTVMYAQVCDRIARAAKEGPLSGPDLQDARP